MSCWQVFTLSGRLKTNFCWLVADAATFPELTFSGGLKINCLLLDVENVDDKLILPAIGAGELDCDPRPKLKDGMVETCKGKKADFQLLSFRQVNQNILNSAGLLYLMRLILRVTATGLVWLGTPCKRWVCLSRSFTQKSSAFENTKNTNNVDERRQKLKLISANVFTTYLTQQIYQMLDT